MSYEGDCGHCGKRLLRTDLPYMYVSLYVRYYLCGDCLIGHLPSLSELDSLNRSAKAKRDGRCDLSIETT